MGEEKKLQLDIASFLEFIKSSFKATLDNIYEIQELSEKVLAEISKNEKIIHDDAERALMEFLKTSKKSREEFKSVMENGFKQLESIFKKQQ
ncbi:hypothetical protein [Candidatus Magnetominusculus xianensis]|uniref:Pyrroline-5-carboxylate reductase n=1 Tax=Candidatus Magnetominusculus xianensis TaxID=1748249 RepID=A0ABR5SDY1_9BACT|nr:hypothetical protein [Candidatus Magnetominusculus xianensis]KWT79692.1 hypothetical protein ASN18_2665 [Candidatus Magnetominusculus xianensis]MBF0404768.1 hypothetical protein [Nitrospirota bacterium]